MKISAIIVQTGLYVVLLALVVVPAVAEADSEGLPSTITFWVAKSDDSKPLSGVTVSAVFGDGSLDEIGSTDDAGAIEVNRDSLLDRKPVVILFCKDGFFCGAFRVEADYALDIDGRVIHLARFAIS